VTPQLIAAIRDLPKVCNHLHLPVQSGSNRILKAMRRRYTREEYLDLVTRLRSDIPSISLSTDMIVGFPGETDADFKETLDLVRRSRFSFMYSFKYSPRPNTLASKRMPDDVVESEKTRRIMALQATQGEAQQHVYQGLVGQVVDVLIESRSRRRDWEVTGRTAGWIAVNLAGTTKWIGRCLPVRITAAAPNSLRGEVMGESYAD